MGPAGIVVFVSYPCGGVCCQTRGASPLCCFLLPVLCAVPVLFAAVCLRVQLPEAAWVMHALCTLSPILAREQTENARAHEGGRQSAERSPTNGVDSQSSARSPAPDGDRQSAARSLSHDSERRSSARSPTPVFPSSESPPTAAPAPPPVHTQKISALLSPSTVALQHIASCSLPQQQTALATPKSTEEDDARKPASGRGSRICPHCGVYACINVRVCAYDSFFLRVYVV